jgi:hypothetical protein
VDSGASRSAFAKNLPLDRRQPLKTRGTTTTKFMSITGEIVDAAQAVCLRSSSDGLRSKSPACRASYISVGITGNFER